MIGDPDVAEHLVVVEPQNPDDGEADYEAYVAGSLLSEAVGERSALGVDVHLEDEQGNSDGEDAVTEGLDSAGVNLASHPLTLYLGWALAKEFGFC